MQIRRFVLVLCSVAVLVGFAGTSFAGPTWKERTEAHKLVGKGSNASKAESWEEAREAFEAALELHDTPRARKGLAKALYELGLLIEAREHAQIVADNKRAGWWDRKHAKDLLEKIAENLPRLTIEVPPDFQGVVRLDDEALGSDDYGTPKEMNPGTVSIHAEADGSLPFDESVVLAEGADETVTISLEPEPAPEPEKDEDGAELSSDDGSTRKTLGYVSLAIGGVGLLAGTVYGLSARGTRSDLDDACPNDVCTENERDAYDEGKRQANIATAGFVVGGVGLGLGAVLLLTGPNDQESVGEEAKVQPFIGPASAGVRGTF